MRSCPWKRAQALEIEPQSPEEAGPPETASELAAEKVSAESIAAFAKRGAAARTEATKRLEADLGKLREQLKAFKAGTINKRLSAAQMSENRFVLTQVKNRTVVVYPDEESKREQISKVEAAVARLDAAVKLVRDPQGGLASFLALAGPELARNQVGDIGFLPELEVIQIAGSDEFHTYLGDLRVAVRGYDTAGIAKGSKVPGGVMYVCRRRALPNRRRRHQFRIGDPAISRRSAEDQAVRGDRIPCQDSPSGRHLGDLPHVEGCQRKVQR